MPVIPSERGVFAMRRFHASHQAFTLVELIVICAILGVLALLAIQSFTHYTIVAKNNRCLADIRTLDKAIVAYYLDKNTWPATLQEAGVGGQLDPWQRSYEYQVHSGGATPLKDFLDNRLNNDYDLYTKGADGLTDADSDNAAAADDIVRTNDGQNTVFRFVLGLGI